MLVPHKEGSVRQHVLCRAWQSVCRTSSAATDGNVQWNISGRQQLCNSGLEWIGSVRRQLTAAASLGSCLRKQK